MVRIDPVPLAGGSAQAMNILVGRTSVFSHGSHSDYLKSEFELSMSARARHPSGTRISSSAN
jgi:hypothetical protein